MRSFAEVFRLEARRIARTGVFPALCAVAAIWMFLVPCVLKTDGTESGAREMYVRYSMGGAFAIVLVALAASAAGSVSSEREEKRLETTLTRPVRFASVALARTAALSAAGAAVLALCSAILAAREGPGCCFSVHSPVMESPRSEAERMYGIVMADPATPPEVKKAPKDTVIRILEQKAVDNYQTIPPGETASWKMGEIRHGDRDLAVRLRFASNFDTRERVDGVFRFGGRSGAVSNITQTVLVTPLDGISPSCGGAEQGGLVFENKGGNSLMLRPRKDIKLLVEGDSTAMNVFRAWLVLSSMLALTISFGVFLGSFLGRSVATFTVMSLLAVMEMSPSVVEQYPDPLETDKRDRISLALTRFAQKATSPVGSFTPVESLAAGDMIETREVARALVEDLAVLPLLLSLVSGLAMSLKSRGENF